MLYKMNIYKGHVYIIICNVNPKIYYIGSTFNELKQRWKCHKKNHINSETKCSISKYFEKYKIENFTMKLLKSYNVYREHNKDNKHLRAYEQLWMNKLRDCCNERNSFNILWKKDKQITDRKYRKKNTEHLKITKKEYYDKNKEEIKKYAEENKEKISKRTKIYREKNKEKIKIMKKEYCEEHKEEIREKAKEKMTCDCGSTFRKCQKKRHERTIKHKNYINLLE